jgi:catechol 2,3-dioxygenase-like lactoylglutathione lyase family enzyme
VDWKLELIVVPVSDVDRSKAFYLDQLGFGLEVDHRPNEHFRVVQMTPKGSACSIAIGVGIGSSEPGSLKGLHLIVSDIEAARSELVSRNVDVSDYFHFGAAGRADGLHPGRGNYETFLSLDDPDGNAWVVQEVGHTKPA